MKTESNANKQYIIMRYICCYTWLGYTLVVYMLKNCDFVSQAFHGNKDVQYTPPATQITSYTTYINFISWLYCRFWRWKTTHTLKLCAHTHNRQRIQLILVVHRMCVSIHDVMKCLNMVTTSYKKILFIIKTETRFKPISHFWIFYFWFQTVDFIFIYFCV